MEFDYQEVRKAVEQGNSDMVVAGIEKALSLGQDVGEILNEGLIKAMTVVGERFKRSEIFVPEVLVAARAMKAGMEILRPILVKTGVSSVGKVVLGTVKGDLHDIGKNLVGMMFEGSGFEVVDLGIDVPPEKFVDSIKKEKPDIVGMSALLTTTMIHMKDTIMALRECEIRDQVLVLVGGAPVTSQYAKEIGADGYAPDASSAVSVAKALLKDKKEATKNDASKNCRGIL